MAFSSRLLPAVGYAEFIVTGLEVLFLAQTLMRYAMGISATGFTKVVAMEILLGGTVLMAFGVISLYLSDLYGEQKGGPFTSCATRRQD